MFKQIGKTLMTPPRSDQALVPLGPDADNASWNGGKGYLDMTRRQNESMAGAGTVGWVLNGTLMLAHFTEDGVYCRFCGSAWSEHDPAIDGPCYEPAKDSFNAPRCEFGWWKDGQFVGSEVLHNSGIHAHEADLIRNDKPRAALLEETPIKYPRFLCLHHLGLATGMTPYDVLDTPKNLAGDILAKLGRKV